MEECTHSKHCDDDDGQQRGLQISYSPHENSVWHTIHNTVTKKIEKHTEFNKKRNLNEKTKSLQSLL